MKNRIKIRQMTTMIVTIFLLILVYLICVSGSYAADVLMIANKDVPADALSKNEIRSIFLGEKTMWGNNQKITFVILKTAEHEVFLREYLGNTAAQYLNYWKKMVFTGKSKSPKSFRTAEKLVDYVSEKSGTVGYIPSGAYNDKVKTISVK